MTDPTSQRFRRVLDHIDSHLDGDLSLDALAKVAAYSRHHFHRRFAALTGMPAHRYVQLMRFRRAAWQAAFRSDVALTTIGLDAGYDSAAAARMRIMYGTRKATMPMTVARVLKSSE